MTTAEVLSLVERAFPIVPMPPVADLTSHGVGCFHCDMTAIYLAEQEGPLLSNEAIRWLCDELSTLSPVATVWMLTSLLRYVLTEQDTSDYRPTEFLIYSLSPAPEHEAITRDRLALLSDLQIEALRAVFKHLADTPYWAEHCGDNLDCAAVFLQEIGK